MAKNELTEIRELYERRIDELERQLLEEGTRRLDLKRARLKDWAYCIAFVFGAFTVCIVFTGVVTFSCYAQIKSVAFALDLPLMWFLFVTVGALIGINAKELVSSVGRIGEKP